MAYNKAYYHAHKRAIQASRLKWQKSPSGKRSRSAAQKRLRQKNGYFEKQKLKRLQKLEEQASRPMPKVCEVCAKSNGKKRLFWDHDHITGKFRGWLCHHCNCALGNVKDSPEVLRLLAFYLEGKTCL